MTPKLCLLNKTRLADLVRTDPFSLDRPYSATSVFWIIAGEVAVFDQATAGVIAEKVDDLELQLC